MIKEIQFSHILSLFFFKYVPSFPLSPPVEGATTRRRRGPRRLKALPSLQSSRPLFFIRREVCIRATEFCWVFCFVFSTEILLFFLLSCLLVVFFFSGLSFFPFSPCVKSAKRSKSSVFSHDATSIRPNKEVNHGETCVLFSILSSFFFFFFFFLSEDARARGLLSRACVLERDFLFFSLSRWALVLALPFCGIGLHG